MQTDTAFAVHLTLSLVLITTVYYAMVVVTSSPLILFIAGLMAGIAVSEIDFTRVVDDE